MPLDKLDRAKSLLEELLQEKGRFVKFKNLAEVVGIIGSFYLAMGNICRFHDRGMISQIASVKERYGWNLVCPNGMACHYRHCLPPGFVLKKNVQ